MVPAPLDQHGDVRRLVLDAALDIITSSGAESLSMREVARRAGVSHQAPYHYFGDRSGIFAAISEEGFSALAGVFRDVQESTISAAKAGFIAYLDFHNDAYVVGIVSKSRYGHCFISLILSISSSHYFKRKSVSPAKSHHQ